jgi:hypothetical protein
LAAPNYLPVEEIQWRALRVRVRVEMSVAGRCGIHDYDCVSGVEFLEGGLRN